MAKQPEHPRQPQPGQKPLNQELGVLSTRRSARVESTPFVLYAPIDVYWNHSPLKYVANVKTPTIILVGRKDERVPAPQSVEMYRGLKSNGVPMHLYIGPREPHG